MEKSFLSQQPCENASAFDIEILNRKNRDRYFVFIFLLVHFIYHIGLGRVGISHVHDAILYGIEILQW